MVAASEEANQRFRIKKWEGTAFWTFAPVEKCKICLRNLVDYCLNCRAESQDYEKEECTLTRGACGHSAHSHCLVMWRVKHPTAACFCSEETSTKGGHLITCCGAVVQSSRGGQSTEPVPPPAAPEPVPTEQQ
ncbi:hypothetical protein ACP4OV_014914 [Aristida adscensionis]